MDKSLEQAEIIASFVQKLDGLGIDAQFSRIEEGPVVTGYYVTLDHSVPISKILRKEEDFALAAGVDKVVIERQGGEVVIFVPNKDRLKISFMDCLHWLCTSPENVSLKLPVMLGVNHLGIKSALDLTEMPHILIAGETGSGKSVLEAAILCGLCVLLTPEELQVYLVDTKQLDLPLFRGMPHVKEVIENLEEFYSIFSDLMLETRRRMLLIKAEQVRNIVEFNDKMEKAQMFRRRLPYIIVMIDELADLIDQDRARRRAADKKDSIHDKPNVEQHIKGLVQICRAAGIHIICCTQRSSVKVVSGDIKANLPCRISLRLPTEADSRTILGTGGAENLLGKGDMLVQKPGADVVYRYHGPLVDMNDIHTILGQHDFIRDSFKQQLLAKVGG